MIEKRLSPAEWEVMEILWRKNPLGSWNVVEALADSKSWSPKTVKSFLSRLAKKGYLGFETEANRYLYYPLVSREECLKREGVTFLERLFHGDVSSLILHFYEQGNLSREDVAALRERLEKDD